jgi:hypothetical protein
MKIRELAANKITLYYRGRNKDFSRRFTDYDLKSVNLRLKPNPRQPHVNK